MMRLSLNSKIWIVVVIIHFISILFISSSLSKEKKEKKKLLVVTKQVVPKIATPNIITKIEKTSLLPPLPKKTTLIKKVSSQPKAKPPPKSSKQVLKKIDKRLAKPHSPPVKQLPITSIEEPLSSYVDSACLVFKEALLLPEKGQVKLTITVQPNGKIGKMNLETFESTVNLDYLMAVLPTLSLPIPERGKDATFTILFCND